MDALMTRVLSRHAGTRAVDAAEIRGEVEHHLNLSFDLDPWLYGDSAVIQALRRFATSGSGGEVRVLNFEDGCSTSDIIKTIRERG